MKCAACVFVPMEIVTFTDYIPVYRRYVYILIWHVFMCVSAELFPCIGGAGDMSSHPPPGTQQAAGQGQMFDDEDDEDEDDSEESDEDDDEAGEQIEGKLIH